MEKIKLSNTLLLQKKCISLGYTKEQYLGLKKELIESIENIINTLIDRKSNTKFDLLRSYVYGDYGYSLFKEEKTINTLQGVKQYTIIQTLKENYLVTFNFYNDSLVYEF